MNSFVKIESFSCGYPGRFVLQDISFEIEKFKIFAMPTVAARPYKKFGKGRFKRTHVTIKLIPKALLKKDLGEKLTQTNEGNKEKKK